jgi:hypothetical protein
MGFGGALILGLYMIGVLEDGAQLYICYVGMRE